MFFGITLPINPIAMPHSQNQFSWTKFLSRFIGISLLLIMGFILVFYLSAPFYTFKQPEQFTGKLIYNPYSHISNKIQKDFSFQMNAHHFADVLLNGKFRINLKHNDSIVYAPQSMDVSNFQFIRQFIDSRGDFLNIYRHGYGITNDQQLCIGARKVVWTDYPFFQNLRHKQDIIDRLLRSSRLVALSDPSISYSEKELKYLSGYQLMEFTNVQEESVNSWDLALSNGHRVNLMLSNIEFKGLIINELMLHSNHLFTKTDSPDAVIQALDQGSFFSLTRPATLENSITIRLKSASVERDTFFVLVEPLAASFRFIGQDGKLLQKTDSTDLAAYPIQDSDSYVRTEITFYDGSVIFLNPLSRQKDPEQERQKLYTFNATHTALMRGVYIVLIMLLLQIIYRWQVKKIRK